jgi:glutaredoxin
MTTIVWSKNQCIYCEWAKNLLRENEIEFEERNINVDYNKQDMINYLEEYHDIDSQQKITMPQIIVANHYVGGFSELKTHLKS